MKQFFLSLMFVVLALVASTASATANTVAANTVTVERIFTSNLGAAMTSYTYTLRLGTAELCTSKATELNNKPKTITLAGRPIESITFATCNSVDYSVQY